MSSTPFAYTYLRFARRFASSRDDHANIQFPKGTFGPGGVPKAYRFLANQGKPKSITKYGIGALGGAVVEADVRTFCQAGNYPMAKLIVLQVGSGPVVSDPGGANVETQLDIQRIIEVWNTAFPDTPCDITIAIGPNSDLGIAQVTQALDNAGCTDINWSWGAPLTQWTSSSRSATENVFAVVKSKKKTICAASGDNSVNDGTGRRMVDFPCASLSVWAVGGTAMIINSAGLYVSEKAWGDGLPGDEGGGGGFDQGTPLPPFQQGVVSGSFFGRPDSSGNADPNTGYQVIADGKWSVVGGTSASSPLTCGYFGVIRALGGDFDAFQAVLYTTRKTSFTDVQAGSNGDPAVAGWDSATGLGSIAGVGFAAALKVGSLPPPPPPPVGQGTLVGTVTPVQDLVLKAGKTYKIFEV